MKKLCYATAGLMLLASTSLAVDSRRFRGPTGQGTSDEKGLPTEWSSQKNIVWKMKFPGAGASSPVTFGKHVFLTCLLRLRPRHQGARQDGRPQTPSPLHRPHQRQHRSGPRNSSRSCPSTNTPAKVRTMAMPPARRSPMANGSTSSSASRASSASTSTANEIWHASVGKGTNGWGSGASPMLYKNLLIVNASIESSSLVALDKMTGKEVWRRPRSAPPGTPRPRHHPGKNEPNSVSA